MSANSDQYLFGNPEHLPQVSEGRITTRHSNATPAPIGSGPEGMTCKECRFIERVQHRDKVYLKCALMRSTRTHGTATDIRASWPACIQFQEKKDGSQ